MSDPTIREASGRDLERWLTDRLQARVEPLFEQVIAELNAAGRRFERVVDAPWQWREPGDSRALDLGCAFAVTHGKAELPLPTGDADLVAYMTAATSGEAPLAATLLTLEADVNNGGFSQLHVNQGSEFMRTAQTALATIGARRLAELVGQANALIDAAGHPAVHDAALRKALERLDVRYIRCRESIPALYARHAARSGAPGQEQ